MPITVEEVRALAGRWCEMLRKESGSVEERESYFVTPEPRIYVQETGISLNMAEHAAFHSQFGRQVLEIGDFTVTQLSEDPERARALGSLYWEAHYPEGEGRAPLRCVVGEDWLLERLPSGEVKFVLWLNTLHHFLPGSGAQALET